MKRTFWLLAVFGPFIFALLATSHRALAAVSVPPPPIERDFEIAYVRGQLWNPWTLSHDAVELRSYRGSGMTDGDFVAPTLRVAPGQTLRVNLDNRLPPCTDSQISAGRCFNETNLHTHGLWVSPAGNSDNVLISIAPGRHFQYEYSIPNDHPAGTFWYHPHRHGNGFVQVGSGMAGALVVTGDRLPTAEGPGDIDILLRDRNGPFAERILLFQQIQYACLDQAGAIQGRMENEEFVRPWVCASDETGRIESPDHDLNWVNSGRFTGINGRVQPLLGGSRAGRFERWRLIHGGTREAIHMRFYRLADGAPDLRTVRAGDQSEWIQRHCQGEPLPMWHIALDGLTRSEIRRADEAVLFAGERMDVLTYFPVAGRYCLIQDTSRRNVADNPSRMLSVLDVARGTPASADPSALLLATLTSAAERALAGSANAPVRQRVIADLQSGMSLGAFVWHPQIREAEISGHREAVLSILAPPETSGIVLFHMNGVSYDHDRIDHMLPLGGVEQWHVRSLLGGHPIHIHVNPFQIVSILDAQGRDVADPQGPAYDADYGGLIGQWKDTVFVKPGHRVIFRTRYERFVGDFVIHCHIMFHGDHGMMQNLRIFAAAEGQGEPHH